MGWLIWRLCRQIRNFQQETNMSDIKTEVFKIRKGLTHDHLWLSNWSIGQEFKMILTCKWNWLRRKWEIFLKDHCKVRIIIENNKIILVGEMQGVKKYFTAILKKMLWDYWESEFHYIIFLWRKQSNRNV